MADSYSVSPDPSGADRPRGPTGSGSSPTVVVQNLPPRQPWFSRWVINLVLVVSLIANFSLFGLYQQYYPAVTKNEQYKQGDRYAKDKIAIIKVSGMITTDSVASPKKELGYAKDDADVRAVILAVDSPGGTIAGSDDLYHAIEDFKSKSGKPLVVSMQGIATSGAYYISMPADRIFAERTCITGSIGVIASLFNVEKLMKDWGVESEAIKSGKLKDSGSPFRSMTPEERQEWQNLIDGMFTQFLGVIMKYRTDEIGGEEKLRQLADGRIFLAAQAKEAGLIDEIGYQEDAIEHVKKTVNLGDKVRIVTYSRPFDGLLDLFESKSQAGTFDVGRLMELQVPMLVPGAFFGAK